MEEYKEYKVSIVIPCFNEQGNISILYDKLNTILENEKIEIIFIDDCSSDKTLEIINEIAMKDNNVKFVSFSRNFGHQSALRAGIEHSSGDCIVSMDGDLQHPPELIPEMISKWKAGFSIVLTIRRDIDNIGFFKKFTSSIFYKIINSLSEIKIRKGAADFRLIDRKIADILINDITEYHLFYRGIISWIGFKQTFIEYVPYKRYSGKTKYTLSKMISFAIDGITSFSIKPLKLAILLGFLLSFLSGIYGFYALYMSVFTSNTVKGWTSVLISILFIGGVNMILLGIIGEYLGKLYIQSKKRPYYLVKQTNIRNKLKP